MKKKFIWWQHEQQKTQITSYPGHAYTVLGILEINSKQVMKLRNSWVNFEFIGDWSEWNYRYDQIIKEKITDIELLLIPKLF